jgi:hypothetical protein
MADRQKRVREKAADLIAECGPYARMAALFLAGERQEEGDVQGAVLWTRVAGMVAEIGDGAARTRCVRLH